MKRFIFAAIIASSASLAHAEEDGLSLMERGARLFFDGLLQEVDPALKELQDMAKEFEPSLRSFAENIGPSLRGLMEDVGDWSQYHPPEMLENGDIILRKKTPEEMEEDVPEGQIEI